jgi:hypothetical protein
MQTADRGSTSSILTAIEGDSEQRRPFNPIWQAALDRYFVELRKGDVKDSVIEKDLWNVKSSGDLLAQIRMDERRLRAEREVTPIAMMG